LVPGNARAGGLLIAGLSDDEWHIVDDFEDEMYELRRLTLSDGRTGWAYVCGENYALAEDWDMDLFTSRDLVDYVERCLAWRGAR